MQALSAGSRTLGTLAPKSSTALPPHEFSFSRNTLATAQSWDPRVNVPRHFGPFVSTDQGVPTDAWGPLWGANLLLGQALQRLRWLNERIGIQQPGLQFASRTHALRGLQTTKQSIYGQSQDTTSRDQLISLRGITFMISAAVLERFFTTPRSNGQSRIFILARDFRGSPTHSPGTSAAKQQAFSSTSTSGEPTIWG